MMQLLLSSVSSSAIIAGGGGDGPYPTSGDIVFIANNLTTTVSPSGTKTEDFTITGGGYYLAVIYGAWGGSNDDDGSVVIDVPNALSFKVFDKVEDSFDVMYMVAIHMADQSTLCTVNFTPVSGGTVFRYGIALYECVALNPFLGFQEFQNAGNPNVISFTAPANSAYVSIVHQQNGTGPVVDSHSSIDANENIDNFWWWLGHEEIGSAGIPVTITQSVGSGGATNRSTLLTMKIPYMNQEENEGVYILNSPSYVVSGTFNTKTYIQHMTQYALYGSSNNAVSIQRNSVYVVAVL